MIRLAHSRVAALLGCAVVLPAQNGLHESRGPLSGATTAVLVDGGLAGLDAQTRVHRNGFALLPTAPLPAANNPPDLHTILFVTHLAPADLDVDDFSLGRDDVLVEMVGPHAVLAVPPSSWGVLSFSLRQGALGQAGSRIAEEAALGSIGAAVFSWVLPGSNLPAQVVGEVERSHSRQELVLPVAAEVDGLDFPLTLGLNQATLIGFEPGFGAIGGPAQAIYFTVSHATRHRVPVAWWGAGSPTLNMSGATILVTERSTLVGPWSQPHVFRTYGSLGLAQDEDIDGLAYDAVRERLLYSTTGTTRDQFLFADLSTDGGPAVPEPVKLPSGTPVSTQVGKLQNDDVDAVCTLDPTIGTIGGPPPGGDDFGSSCGSPRPGLLGVPSVHAAAFRRFNGVANFDTWIMGWPPVTGVAPGIALLFVTIGNDVTLFPVGPIHFRDTSSAVPGDPKSYTFPIPGGYPLTGQRITFRWVAIDAAFTEIAEAWPVQVNL